MKILHTVKAAFHISGERTDYLRNVAETRDCPLV